jgi:redox-sensitive bicupin YhaK (pirin superfamily)
MKTVLGLYSNPHSHWVGDGFPVRSLFDYQGLGRQLSPFLLLDYAAPTEFTPAERPRGVGQHPHRGFETVTIVYEGEVAHRDSTGQGGVIGPGDVQWMTAGAGILHEEFHSQAFTRRGGRMQMVQLWVNLPARDKMTAPGYQAIVDAQIPRIRWADGAGEARVIAGQFEGVTGPARTFSPLQVVDLTVRDGQQVRLGAPEGWNTALVVLSGEARLQGEHVADPAQLAVLSQQGEGLQLQAQGEVRALLLSGQPLNEPIVGHGPFVMNTPQEIRQAIVDFNAGRFGQMPH